MTPWGGSQRLSRWDQMNLFFLKVRYTLRGRKLRHRRAEYERVQKKIDELRLDYDHLRYLDNEFHHVPSFFRLINLDLGNFDHYDELSEPDKPTRFVSGDPLEREPGYTLHPFYLHSRANRAA